MKTCSDTPLKRGEKFTRLADFFPAFISALQEKKLATEDIFVACRNFVSLECTECHTIVPGEELYLLSQPAEGEEINPGLRRLRLGFCPNVNCKSYDCTITFKSNTSVHWTDRLRRVDHLLEDLEDSRAGRGKRWRSALIRPAIITVVGLLMILLLRQLYLGGRIPLLREPEKFRVDPWPQAAPRR